MSGDVQPRKRKDKKRKKDELGVEEHRGTAAVFGEGDVLMHSHHEHGTGGHWCAKIIFFSLLAVLVTLIGLIILENRGLSELEANAVESRYSGVLDGWIEEAPEDDHHDEHTLELKHHDHVEDEEDQDLDSHDDGDDEEIDHENEIDDDENDEDDEDGDDDDDGDDEDGGDDNDGDEEDGGDGDSQELGDDEQDDNEDELDNDSEENIERYSNTIDNDDDDDQQADEEDDDHQDDEDEKDEDDDEQQTEEDNEDEDDDDQQADEDEKDEDDDEDGQSEEENIENNEEEDDHEDEHEESEEAEEEIEKIEKEVTDQEEPESVELPLPEASVEREDEASVEMLSPDAVDQVDVSEYLEADDLDEPAVERIAPPPPGKPYVEIEEPVSTEAPPNTLAEEEEYEKQQEQLRQEEEQSTHRQIFAQGQEHWGVWLKLAVGGALLAATHAVIRRAAAPRDAPESEVEEHDNREETPVTDRRMTLVQEEAPKLVPVQSVPPKVEEEVIRKSAPVEKAVPVQKQESEEVEEDEETEEGQETEVTNKNKELYSDEDENEEDEEVEEEEEIEEKVVAPKSVQKVAEAKKDEESEHEDVPEDVEIIDEDEEVEEEVEDEEEISDVDDAELLSRLEAKYGRLPEPDRPGHRHKDGGNSVEDDWPGEPSDAFWREQLDKAEQELRQGAFGACEERAAAPELAASARARWLRARALDAAADTRRDNRLLARAIAAYLQLLKMNERLSDKRLLEVALRTIDRIQFRGTYLNAEPVYRLLIRRFPNDVTYRNNLTISFLMANRADLATEVLKETLRLWPDDRVALAHYGFVLKTEQNKVEESIAYFQKALEGDAGPASEPRFYYHLGDALLLLGRKDEAHEVHKRGAALGHFLSPSQRSLYNVPRLKSQPWWDVTKTPYAKLARELEKWWREILKEGEAASALYEKEKEGLRERGEWSQLDMFVRGEEVAGRCRRAPVTCGIVRAEPAARCRRGQVKFSVLSAGTHVRAHVGPTNCRLRMHLALSNTENTYLRVDQETRQWEVGKVLMFDDSFEHEVWHNGTGARLVLIVDVWHPDLTPHERRSLPAI